MDSTISTLFSAIIGIELVTTAFIIISGLRESFTSFVLKSYGANANTPVLMRRFQDVFAEYFRSEIKKLINFPYLHPNICNEKSKSNYEIIIKTFMLDTQFWNGAFIKFKNIIRVELNMRSSKFEYALDNITEFSDGFNKYMTNFAKTNQISEDSDMYRSKFNHLKQWLQSAVDERINDHQDQHIDICADMGYEYNCPVYELCRSCTRRRTHTWLKRLNEYIQTEFDSFESVPIDEHITITSTNDVDEKELRRNHFNKRIKMTPKDKQRYLRNKGILSKDNRKKIKEN